MAALSFGGPAVQQYTPMYGFSQLYQFWAAQQRGAQQQSECGLQRPAGRAKAPQHKKCDAAGAARVRAATAATPQGWQPSASTPAHLQQLEEVMQDSIFGLVPRFSGGAGAAESESPESPRGPAGAGAEVRSGGRPAGAEPAGSATAALDDPSVWRVSGRDGPELRLAIAQQEYLEAMSPRNFSGPVAQELPASPLQAPRPSAARPSSRRDDAGMDFPTTPDRKELLGRRDAGEGSGEVFVALRQTLEQLRGAVEYGFTGTCSGCSHDHTAVELNMRPVHSPRSPEVPGPQLEEGNLVLPDLQNYALPLEVSAPRCAAAEPSPLRVGAWPCTLTSRPPSTGGGAGAVSSIDGVGLAQPRSHAAAAESRNDRTLSSWDVQEALARAHIFMSSLKGNKEPPNQDRVICGLLQGGCQLVGVLDGHGKSGHVVAQICAEVLPKLLLRRIGELGGLEAPPTIPRELPENVAKWREAVVGAFVAMHGMLEASTVQYLEPSPLSGPLSAATAQSVGVDARASGTTATVVLALPMGQILVAHVGDSRAVLGIRKRAAGSGAWRCLEITRDHKGTIPEERARIEQAGAKVVELGKPPQTVARVYTSKQTWPSINMTRSLGDLHAHTQGLSPVAEVNALDQLWDPTQEEAVLIIASDGVWEVMTNEEVVEYVVAPCPDSDPSVVVAQEALSRWRKRFGPDGYSDDISLVVRFF